MKCYDLTKELRVPDIIWVIDNSVIISTKQYCCIPFHKLGFVFFLIFPNTISPFSFRFKLYTLLILSMPKF